MAKQKRRNLRPWVQGVWTVVTNSYLVGFAKGKLYQGPIKNLCVPGLNCYSCPGAVGSCPIGALQAVIGSRDYHFAFYVVGFLMAVGAICGRFVCGWLCPFGWIQELIHKIPFPKKIRSFRWDKPLRFLKYGILVVFVILLPLFLVDFIGQGEPFFCKLICPAGTLEGGIPMVLLNEPLRATIGWLYTWKMAILAVLIFLSILTYRPFCKYLCPLGAVYGLTNPVSFYKLRVDEEKCIHCGKCAKVCPMQVDPVKSPNALECIRCGECKKACPTGAISMGFGARVSAKKMIGIDLPEIEKKS